MPLYGQCISNKLGLHDWCFPGYNLVLLWLPPVLDVGLDSWGSNRRGCPHDECHNGSLLSYVFPVWWKMGSKTESGVVFAPFYHETGNTYVLCTVVLTKRSSNLTWCVKFQQPLFLPKPAVDLCFLAAGFVRPVASPPARHGERPSCYCVWLARLLLPGTVRGKVATAFG